MELWVSSHFQPILRTTADAISKPCETATSCRSAPLDDESPGFSGYKRISNDKRPCVDQSDQLPVCRQLGNSSSMVRLRQLCRSAYDRSDRRQSLKKPESNGADFLPLET